MNLSSAKKFAERTEETVRKGRRLLGKTLQLLSKRHLFAAMHFTRDSRHFVGGQINVISGPDRLATSSGKLI